jgi:hypothetical protein
MPPWVPIAASAAVAVLAIGVTAAINIRIKFAPDAATASREVRTLVLRIVQWLANGYLAISLALAVLSAQPVTRAAVFQIALSTTVLVSLAIVALVNEMNSTIRTIIGTVGTLHELMDARERTRQLQDKTRRLEEETRRLNNEMKD